MPSCTAQPSRAEPTRIVVVLNPAAGRSSGRAHARDLADLLRRRAISAGGCAWRVTETLAAGDACSIARAAVSEGATIVAAAGGDGTVGEVANGLAGTTACLGLLPLGTGNDLARHLGVPLDLPAAVEVLFGGQPEPLDVGCCNSRRFVNVAGCGFDGAVAERVNRGFRYLRGRPAYLASIVSTLLTFRAAGMRITLDDEEMAVRALLCSVANASSYGGGMRVAPDASTHDGLFDVCVVAEAGRVEFLRALPRVFRGTHTTHPKVTIRRAAHVRVESERPLPVLIDGDMVGTTPAEFTIEPHALQVMVPRRYGGSHAG